MSAPPRMRVSWAVPRTTKPVPPLTTPVPALPGVVRPVAYSPGSRAKRAPAGPAAAGSTGALFSVARYSIEAILVTETTWRSSAREHAVSTGPGP